MYITYVPKFVKHAPINPDKRGSMTHPHIGKYSMSYRRLMCGTTRPRNQRSTEVRVSFSQ
jgi:hypothetical protein